jgi:DNA-binding NtrC family response regulator
MGLLYVSCRCRFGASPSPVFSANTIAGALFTPEFPPTGSDDAGRQLLKKGRMEMNTPWQILVASSDPESRRWLIQILTRQGGDPISASNLVECRETMEKERVGLIFADRHLADGNYRDVLELARSKQEKVRVVVISRHPDWDEYLEAMRLGAFDVIASPCRPTDVEWMVIQAKRDDRNRTNQLVTAGLSDTGSLHRVAAGGA